MNEAQKLLISIGGTAQLVAGHMKHYWADPQTPKKEHKRLYKLDGKRVRGDFGKTLKAHFDSEAMKVKA